MLIAAAVFELGPDQFRSALHWLRALEGFLREEHGHLPATQGLV